MLSYRVGIFVRIIEIIHFSSSSSYSHEEVFTWPK